MPVEMKVWVGCARGVQVAYVTLHHRGCTLVPPSTWAKRVPRAHTTPPGMAGWKPSTRTNTHTPQRPNQEWRGTAETRVQAHTSTPHTPARSSRVQAGRAHKHTHAPTPQPGVAGRGCNPTQSTQPRTAPPARRGRGPGGTRTQTHTPQHLSQEWRGAAETRAQAHTPTPHTRAGSGGVQAERAHNHARPKT